jgi:hypothetical protein
MSNTKLTKMNNAEAVSPVIGVIKQCLTKTNNLWNLFGGTYGRDIT